MFRSLLLLIFAWPQTFASAPNILFILADDLGVRDLSVEGSTYHETPHIDRIAREGVRFTHGQRGDEIHPGLRYLSGLLAFPG